MEAQSVFQCAFDFGTSKLVVVEPLAVQVSSDAGLLPFRQLDERLGLTRQLAACLTDRRHTGYIGHTFLEMVRMRVYGILADYPDQNDHDLLRGDPVFKLLCDRSIDDDDLASQPTLSRFENAIGTRSFFRLREMLVDQFMASFDEPPKTLTLDIDPFNDPTHGQQQLTFFILRSWRFVSTARYWSTRSSPSSPEVPASDPGAGSPGDSVSIAF
jgi:hypothetical protein